MIVTGSAAWRERPAAASPAGALTGASEGAAARSVGEATKKAAQKNEKTGKRIVECVVRDGAKFPRMPRNFVKEART
jgi:hypothetical protein